MKYKFLFWFELSKGIIAFLNIAFLVNSHPTISILISILSLITSFLVIAGVVGGSEVAVAGAVVIGAVLIGVAVEVSAAGAAVIGAAIAAVIGAAVADKEESTDKTSSDKEEWK